MKQKRELELEVIPLSTTTKYLAVIFVLIGLILILISLLLKSSIPSIPQEIIKELGIVVLSVFTISIIYERLVAEKYLMSLQRVLGRQLERGEGIAAAALRLGITEIFPSRDEFERKYPLSSWINTLKTGDTLRIVARSLNMLMNKQETLKKAIDLGATVELCLVSPSIDSEIMKYCPDLEISDMQSALNIFKKHIPAWLDSQHPKGSIEIRFHQNPTIDSNLMLEAKPHTRICVWDISFGRDISAKRIFLVDPDKPLAKDLARRYEVVWNNAEKVYHYDGSNVVINKL